MSISALHEVSSEVRRLAIAGASLAPGDFRLKKLIEPLEKSGEKSPVFAKVANSVKTVIESKEQAAPKALLDLSTLVNAILYTQGKTATEGELEELKTSPIEGTTTKTTYRVLAPLIQALTNTGQGRYEIVNDAWKRGAFRDMRLVRPSIQALEDRYGELATLIAEKVLPSFGPGIIPLLTEDFDPKGGILHARKLRAIAGTSPELGIKLAREVIDDATKEVKIAAIECLNGSKEDLELLIGQTKSKTKDVRRAAFSSLAGISTPSVITLFQSAVKTKDLGLVSETIGKHLTADVANTLVEEGNAILETALKNKSPAESLVQRLRHVMSALSGNLNASSEEFLTTVFDEREHFSKLRKSKISGEMLNEELAYLMASTGSESLKRLLIKSHKSLSDHQVACALMASAQIDPPKKVHKDFAPLLLDKKAKGDAVESVLTGRIMYSRNVPETFKGIEWDKGWIKTAIKANRIDSVLALITPGNTAAEKYLVTNLDFSNRDNHSPEILRTLIDLGHKNATKLVCQALKAVFAKKGYHWHSWSYLYLIPELPYASVPEIEKFVKTLSDKQVDDILPQLAELKTKASSSTKQS